MQREDIIKKFEEERWLLLDETLSGKRKKYWNEKIEEISELKEMLNEAKFFSGERDLQWPEYREDELELLIDSALVKINLPVNNKLKLFNSLTSVTLTGAAAALLIIFSLLFAVKIEEEKYAGSWEDTNISKEINTIETAIDLLNNDLYKREIYNKLISDSWTRTLNAIQDQITNLENDIENNNL